MHEVSEKSDSVSSSDSLVTIPPVSKCIIILETLARLLKREWTFWVRCLFIYPIDNLLAYFRKKSHQMKILYSHWDVIENPNLCIFVHCDVTGDLDSHAVHYLRALKNAQCDVVLMSTSPQLTPPALSLAKKYCHAVILRSHLGRDIYSYRTGIEYVKHYLPIYQKLILVSDSVYGPFCALDPLIYFGDDKSLDFWGASDSHQVTYHLQSYFFVFTQKMFLSSVFFNYWKLIKLLNHRRHIIDQYELKMTRYFRDAGFRCDAYCSDESVVLGLPENTLEEKQRKYAMQKCRPDMTHQLWNELIVKYQFPFLKKTLVLKNTAKTAKTAVQYFEEVMAATFPNYKTSEDDKPNHY